MQRIIQKISSWFNLNWIRSLLFDDIKIQNGQIFCACRHDAGIMKLEDAEFKVFLQSGEDGIIDFLLSKINVENKYFVEFGVENYYESNTRFLMMNRNWRGLVIDGSKRNIESIRRSYYYWKHDLNAVSAFITCDNINSLLRENTPEDIEHVGLLSIDIDGNDYWVFKEIDVISADILILEYNSLFGLDKKLTIPYNSTFERYEQHFTGGYFGASLPALIELADHKGYTFVGTNSFGSNAFFINKRHSVANLQVSQNISAFRYPTNVKGKEMLNRDMVIVELKDKELIDLDTMKHIKIYELGLE